MTAALREQQGRYRGAQRWVARIALLSAGLGLATGTPACAQRRSEASPSPVVMAEGKPASPPADQKANANDGARPNQAPGAPPVAPQMQRKLVRDAELRVLVENYDHTRRLLDQKLAAAQGYVETATVQHQDGSVSNAELVLRVPADKLDGLLADIGRLGSIQQENLQTRDISEEYYDAQARLTNTRKLEARLLELVSSKTEQLKDLLELERELSRVREQIETIEGRLRLYDSQVALSKVKLTVTTNQRFEAPPPTSYSSDLGRVLGESTGALLATLRGLSLVAVALLPWLPGLAVLGFLGYWILRRLGRWLSNLTSTPNASAPQPQFREERIAPLGPIPPGPIPPTVGPTQGIDQKRE